MLVEVNGTRHQVSAATLADLIAELGHDPACVATALDGDFVPRGDRGETPLHPGARVEVLMPMQGG